MKAIPKGMVVLALGCAAAWLWFANARVSAAPDQQSEIASADGRLFTEIRAHSEAMKNLEYLSDNIGARLTGSPQLKQANDWTAEIFRKYGLTNVHLEPWSIDHSWTRGTASARTISPTEHPLTIASAGWGPSTPGVIRGPVAYFDAKNKADFARFQGKLKGAIVIYTDPAPLSPFKPGDTYAKMLGPLQEPPPVASPRLATRQENRERLEFFKQEGVAGLLLDSGKPHGLLNMGHIGTGYEISAVPIAFVTGEGYRMLFRMLKHGPVQVEMEIKNTISEKPVEVYNTVAEIRGSEKPDEVVMLGAHLDSWDLGTGSNDNGTGSIAVLEAARALSKLNLKPARTIRFALFTGEEQGHWGSMSYVDVHKNELSKISGIFVHDTGTGRVLTIGLHDNYQDKEITDELIAPMHELKLLEPSMAREYGTDHLSFNEVGVPGFWAMQDPGEYELLHHSQSDTFDKAWKDDLNQGAEVLAAWAYNVAQLPGLLPRHPVTQAAGGGAPSATAAAIEATDHNILRQIKEDEPQLKADLSYLADHIGPRVTGSAELDQASHWSVEQFKAAGLANAKLEPWSLPISWTRGPANARILAIDGQPVTTSEEQKLTIASLAWSPNTKGTIRSDIVPLDFDKPEDLEKYRGKLAGKIVLMGYPVDIESPGNPLEMPWDVDVIPVGHPKGQRMYDPAVFQTLIADRKKVMQILADEKVGVVLRPSEKEYGLLHTTSATGNPNQGQAPIATLAREHYQRLWRLSTTGRVTAEVSLEGTFSNAPVTVYNTVAEIRGTEKPDEVVIIGAHLDSWDMATSATDNGTGSMAVLAAARALQKLNVHPKRTIRFILFTGEEEGILGSREYVKAHKNELDKISGVLVDDMGTGKVLTLDLMGNYAARETVDHAMYPLAKVKEIGFAEPSLRIEGGSDHLAFDEADVPGFICLQDPLDYALTHHSQADTLEHVRWDDLTEGAQVMAVFAYNVAQLPDLLPRKSAKPAQ